jgi:drug/metabolite transporter (DMT)-like permease
MAVSGFSYAVLILNGRYGIGSSDPFGNYLSTFFWGTVLLWGLALPMGELGCLWNAPPAAWAGLIYLGLVPSLAGYGFLLLALKFLPGGPASILSTTEILFAALWGWVLLGEAPDGATWIGAALVIAAVSLTALSERTGEDRITPPAFFRGLRRKS